MERVVWTDEALMTQIPKDLNGCIEPVTTHTVDLRKRKIEQGIREAIQDGKK